LDLIEAAKECVYLSAKVGVLLEEDSVIIEVGSNSHRIPPKIVVVPISDAFVFIILKCSM